VLERNGSISVLRRDRDLDLESLADVPDADQLTAPPAVGNPSMPPDPAR